VFHVAFFLMTFLPNLISFSSALLWQDALVFAADLLSLNQSFCQPWHLWLPP